MALVRIVRWSPAGRAHRPASLSGPASSLAFEALHHIAQVLLEPCMPAPAIAGIGRTFIGGARVERHVSQCQDANLFLGR